MEIFFDEQERVSEELIETMRKAAEIECEIRKESNSAPGATAVSSLPTHPISFRRQLPAYSAPPKPYFSTGFRAAVTSSSRRTGVVAGVAFTRSGFFTIAS